MPKSPRATIKNLLSDRFSSEWKLLSETEAFISHTPEFNEFELQFKDWRARLQDSRTSVTEIAAIRAEMILLRKEFRLRGYDLSLGLQRLVVKGFLNDDAMAEGFQRAVICFCGPETYFHTGTANHVTLADELVEDLERKKLLHNAETHYLWYYRSSKGLILSGSATETAENFERLTHRAEANPLKLLSALTKLT